MQLQTFTSVTISHPSFKNVSFKTRSSFVYALIFFIIFLFITFAIPPRSNSLGYFGALNDKHYRLNHLPSPKIVFIGGSNLAFGLNSGLIETTLHKPVVNMGICAPAGLRYMLEEIKDHVNTGDTIVLIPEYGILQNTVDGSMDIIHVIEGYPASALFILRGCAISPEYISNLAKIALALPAAKWNASYILFSKMWKQGHFNYSLLNDWEIAEPLREHVRYDFNQYGDYLGHLAKQNGPYSPNWEMIKNMSIEAADLLNSFDKFARKHGARIVMIPAPLPSEYLLPKMCSAQNISNWPNQKLTIPILGNPRRYSFAASYFYEVPYHLNLAGRTKRTALVLEDLEQYYKQNNGTAH